MMAGINYGINKIIAIKERTAIRKPAEEIIVLLNARREHLYQKSLTDYKHIRFTFGFMQSGKTVGFRQPFCLLYTSKHHDLTTKKEVQNSHSLRNQYLYALYPDT